MLHPTTPQSCHELILAGESLSAGACNLSHEDHRNLSLGFRFDSSPQFFHSERAVQWPACRSGNMIPRQHSNNNSITYPANPSSNDLGPYSAELGLPYSLRVSAPKDSQSSLEFPGHLPAGKLGFRVYRFMCAGKSSEILSAIARSFAQVDLAG